MIKLLIPAIIITIGVGFLWFFMYPGKEGEVIDWVNDQKNSIMQENEIISRKTDEYQFLEYEFYSYANEYKWKMELVKVDPSQFDFDLIINKKDHLFAISDIAENYDCTVAINGIFFDTDFDPLGLIVDDGKIKNPSHVGELASGIFYLSSLGVPGIVEFDNYIVENDVLALQSGPIILKSDGTSEVSENGIEIDSRSFIAIDEDNYVYLGIVYPKIEKSFYGVSLYDLAQIFTNSEEELGIEMKSVLNLDGGSSTGLYTSDFYFAEKNLPQNVLCLTKN